MEIQQKIGVVMISILTLVAVFWLPLSEYWKQLWITSIIAVGGDAITTSLFSFFDEEEQKGVTRDLCGAQPTLYCVAFTRLPIINSAALLYLAWTESKFVISYGSRTVPPELIPLMLTIGGLFATLWNMSGFVMPE